MRHPDRTAGMAAVALLLATAGCRAQSSPTAVRLASAAQVREAHMRAGAGLLPAGSRQVRFEDNQATVVEGTPRVTLLPVSYRAPVPDAVVEGQTADLCGVLVVPDGGTARLLVTDGVGNTETMSCVGLKAVGGARPAKAGQQPDILLLYHGYTQRNDVTATVLLVWVPATQTYAVDGALSQWLSDQKDGGTVAGARRLLARKQASGMGTGA